MFVVHLANMKCNQYLAGNLIYEISQIACRHTISLQYLKLPADIPFHWLNFLVKT